MRPIWLAATICLLAAPALRAADTNFTGFARSLESGALLYVESHAVSEPGTAREARVVLYRCAEEAPPFARKHLVYGAERTVPTFAFEDARSGFAEGLERGVGGLAVYARPGATGERRNATIAATGELVADAGFDEFVRQRWDSLERGASAPLAFVIPSRLNTFSFRVRKTGEADIQGEAASVFRLSLAGPIGWFAPDIEVSYRQRDRRLMRYRGLTNIRDAAGRLLEAQIDFPDSARDRAAVDLAALRALPLAPGCS